jgi:hypothetical protein
VALAGNPAAADHRARAGLKAAGERFGTGRGDGEQDGEDERRQAAGERDTMGRHDPGLLSALMLVESSSAGARPTSPPGRIAGPAAS